MYKMLLTINTLYKKIKRHAEIPQRTNSFREVSMPKTVRRLVWACLIFSLAAVGSFLNNKPASACPAGYEGTWNGDCTGAARDCSVIYVCAGGRPV
jgi:hypothetical protein